MRFIVVPSVRQDLPIDLGETYARTTSQCYRGSGSAIEKSRVPSATSARRQLSDGGADRITVETIATAAGITRGALYFYFGSKNDVLAALVERTAAAVVTEIEAADQSAPEDPREALRQGISRTAASWAEHGSVMRAAVELSPGVPDDDDPNGARAISAALVSMTERYFYRASKHRTSLADATETLTHIWLAVLPS